MECRGEQVDVLRPSEPVPFHDPFRHEQAGGEVVGDPLGLFVRAAAWAVVVKELPVRSGFGTEVAQMGLWSVVIVVGCIQPRLLTASSILDA